MKSLPEGSEKKRKQINGVTNPTSPSLTSSFAPPDKVIIGRGDQRGLSMSFSTENGGQLRNLVEIQIGEIETGIENGYIIRALSSHEGLTTNCPFSKLDQNPEYPPIYIRLQWRWWKTFRFDFRSEGEGVYHSHCPVAVVYVRTVRPSIRLSLLCCLRRCGNWFVLRRLCESWLPRCVNAYEEALGQNVRQSRAETESFCTSKMRNSNMQVGRSRSFFMLWCSHETISYLQ